MKVLLLGFILLTTLIFVPIVLAGDPATQPTSEKEKIALLLSRISDSKLVFIRNGTEYTGPRAAEHLRAKYDRVAEKIKTADQFVDEIATKSSMSGKPYLVRFDNGTLVELAKWLREGR